MEKDANNSSDRTTENSPSSDSDQACECNNCDDQICHKDNKNCCKQIKKIDEAGEDVDEQCRCALKPHGKTSNKEKNKALRKNAFKTEQKSNNLFENISSSVSATISSIYTSIKPK